MLDAERAGGVGELAQHASVQRLEAALLGGREVLREREVAEALERLAETPEALLE